MSITRITTWIVELTRFLIGGCCGAASTRRVGTFVSLMAGVIFGGDAEAATRALAVADDTTRAVTTVGGWKGGSTATKRRPAIIDCR